MEKTMRPRVCVLLVSASVCIAAIGGCTLGPPVQVAAGPRIAGLSTIAPVVSTLAELGFTIRTLENGTGLVNTEPREGTMPFGKGYVFVRETVQASVSAGGVLVQYNAKCRFETTRWDTCRDLKGRTTMTDGLNQRYKEIYQAIFAKASLTDQAARAQSTQTSAPPTP